MQSARSMIDLSALKVESDYYDNDEIYNALCDYIIEYLSTDSEFDKLVIKVMLQSGMITGDAVVQLLYDQGILNVDGDTEYQEYLAGNYGAYDFMRKKSRIRRLRLPCWHWISVPVQRS